MPNKFWFKCFAVIALIYLTGTLFSHDIRFNFYWKPLLLPPLIFAALLSGGVQHKNYLITGLVFCWIGDVFLMLADLADIYFVFGLAAFLIGHLFYILLFIKFIRSSEEIRVFRPLLFMAILAYLLFFIAYIGPLTGKLFYPVMAYALIIGTMFYLAVVAGSAFFYSRIGSLLSIGAAAFVISDSLLAVNKFFIHIPHAGFWIMVTYLFAQWAITWTYCHAFIRKDIYA